MAKGASAAACDERRQEVTPRLFRQQSALETLHTHFSYGPPSAWGGLSGDTITSPAIALGPLSPLPHLAVWGKSQPWPGPPLLTQAIPHSHHSAEVIKESLEVVFVPEAPHSLGALRPEVEVPLGSHRPDLQACSLQWDALHSSGEETRKGGRGQRVQSRKDE